MFDSEYTKAGSLCGMLLVKIEGPFQIPQRSFIGALCKRTHSGVQAYKAMEDMNVRVADDIFK